VDEDRHAPQGTGLRVVETLGSTTTGVKRSPRLPGLLALHHRSSDARHGRFLADGLAQETGAVPDGGRHGAVARTSLWGASALLHIPPNAGGGAFFSTARKAPCSNPGTFGPCAAREVVSDLGRRDTPAPAFRGTRRALLCRGLILDSDQSGMPDRQAREPAYRLIASGCFTSPRTRR